MRARVASPECEAVEPIVWHLHEAQLVCITSSGRIHGTPPDSKGQRLQPKNQRQRNRLELRP